MDKIRVRIVGASNGVVSNGYAAFLGRIPGVEVVQNLSIGSSHSCLLPGAVEQFDGRQADICVLDLAVNEQRALSRGLYDFETTESLFDYFLGICQKHSMTPVVLLLPLLAGANPSKEALGLWSQLCADRHVLVVDALELAAAEWPGIEARSLWRDPAHPDVALSERIAWEIYNRCVMSHRNETPSHPVPERHFSCYRGFKGKPVRRTTRLTSKDFFVLKEGDHQIINLGRAACIVGIGLNMAKTNGALEITGDKRVLKSLANAFFESRDLWFVYWNLISPVHSSSGAFELHVRRISGGRAFEDNNHRARELPAPDEPIQIEIESLIVEGG